jgi:hypothetical protein
MRRLTSAALFVLLTLAPAAASAVTVDQIIALSKAGISEPIILALTERDKTVLTIGPEQLVSLRRDGLSENVIVAMLKSGREEGEAAANAAAALNSEAIMSSLPQAPDIVVIGHGPQRPNVYSNDYSNDYTNGYGNGYWTSPPMDLASQYALPYYGLPRGGADADAVRWRRSASGGSTASVAGVDRTVHHLPDQRRRSASGRLARLRHDLPARRALR